MHIRNRDQTICTKIKKPIITVDLLFSTWQSKSMSTCSLQNFPTEKSTQKKKKLQADAGTA